jgi:putative aldouronate transport system substrate-binding protein
MKRILSAFIVVLIAGFAFAQPGQEKEQAATLKLYMPPPSNDMSHKDSVLAEVNKMLAPKLGASIDITFVDFSNYQTKINVMLAANEPFDWYTSVGFTDFSTNIAKGILIPLDDLLQGYGKTIVKMTPKDFWPAVTYNGKKYAVINVYPYAQWKGATFDKALVEKYRFNYKGVKTMKDLEPFLAAVKENEPDITPTMGGGYENLMGGLITRYDPLVIASSLSSALISYDTVDKKLVTYYDIPYIRERLATLNGWYKKGYIAKDAAMKKDFEAEVKTRKYAVWGSNVATNGDNVKETTNYGFPCVSVRDALTMIRTANINGVVGYISKTSQRKEKTMAFLDLLWSDKRIFNTLCYGVEGQDYDVVSGAGTDTPTVRTKDPMKWALWHPWIAEMNVNQWPSNWNDAATLEEFRYNNEHAARSAVLGFVFDPTPVKDEVAQLSALFLDMKDVEATGSFDDTDAYIKDMKARLEKVGYSKVFAEVEKQLAAWKKANGVQ